jgi:hypothetical protein
LNVFGSEKKYKALTEELLKEYDEERNLEKIKDIILE